MEHKFNGVEDLFSNAKRSGSNTRAKFHPPAQTIKLFI